MGYNKLLNKVNYISAVEREKCQKVIDAFEELFEDLCCKEDCIVALDAGGYGFVVLQYYRVNRGFEDCKTYTNSKDLFEALWYEWFNTRLLRLTKGTALEEESFEDMFKGLSKETQKELHDRRTYFAEKADIVL